MQKKNTTKKQRYNSMQKKTTLQFNAERNYYKKNNVTIQYKKKLLPQKTRYNSMQTKVTKKNNNVTIQCRKKLLQKTQLYKAIKQEEMTIMYGLPC